MMDEVFDGTVIAVTEESLISNRVRSVSIGMPVFNGAKYIHQALDSLLAQTFRDFELIISDNASTDETGTICKSYAELDPRIRYVKQIENLGPSANFQFVLGQAKGEFFMWAAADDVWDVQWVETLYIRIRGDKTIAGFGELVHIDANASRLVHPANGAKLHFNGTPLNRKLRFYFAFEGAGKTNLFYALYPRAQLNRIELGRGLFDYQILFMLLDHISFVQIKGPKYHKRIHGNNEGGVTDNPWHSPLFLVPVKLLLRDFQFATHYLKNASTGMQVILLLLVPFKIAAALVFRGIQSISRQRTRSQLR
jgi:glycosyltransferase involved in cell wall biosynthesis